MEDKINKGLSNFLSDENEEEFNKKVKEDKKKFIKSDFAIIERVDRILVLENGKQLLREQY